MLQGNFRIVFFAFVLCLFSCSHQSQLKQLNKSELTDYVMAESLLDTALKASVTASTNCIQPFEKSLPAPVYSKMSALMVKNFNQQELHHVIHERLNNKASKEEVSELSHELAGPVWQKFMNGFVESNNKDESVFISLMQSLENGTFNLKTKRTELVAKITDQAYMVNMVKLSNSQMLKMVNVDSGKPMSKKQENIMHWLNMELKTFNDVHVRSLFASTWLATEDFSEKELEELLKIRSHRLITLGKLALEEEIEKRYDNFFKDVRLNTQKEGASAAP